MTASVSAETALTLDVTALESAAPVRRNIQVPRWVEVLLLAAAILVAPAAFVVGLAIYALRRATAKSPATR